MLSMQALFRIFHEPSDYSNDGKHFASSALFPERFHDGSHNPQLLLRLDIPRVFNGSMTAEAWNQSRVVKR